MPNYYSTTSGSLIQFKLTSVFDYRNWFVINKSSRIQRTAGFALLNSVISGSGDWLMVKQKK